MKTQIQTGLLSAYKDDLYHTFSIEYKNGTMQCPDLFNQSTILCSISKGDILEAHREKVLRIKTSNILKFLNSNKSLFFCAFRLKKVQVNLAPT